MTERPYSLIDVQLGMSRLDLHLLLTPPCFTFFWGLIMTANKLTPRFKNPFDLTVLQAQAAGGGSSRQSVWQKQQKLKKVRIDKQWLVKIKCGNYQKNVAATYEINYNLLIPETLTMPVFEIQPSKIIDGSVDAMVTDVLTDPLTILRSEERREEQIPPTPPKIFTTVNGREVNEEELAAGGEVKPFDPNSEGEPGTNEKVSAIQRQILNKYSSQLTQPPGYGQCNDMLQEFGGDTTWILCGITAAPAALKKQTPTAAVNLVRSVAMRLRDEGGNGGNGTAQQKDAAKLALMKKELKEFEAMGEGWDHITGPLKAEINRMEGN
jgi:hypothetical protein